MKAGKKRIIKNLCLLLCLISAVLVGIGSLYNSSVKAIHFSNDFRVGVWNRGFDSQLVFYTHDEYDPTNVPYIIAGSKHTTLFNAIPGIYYWNVKTNTDSPWVFMFSLWYAILIFATLAILFYLQENFRRTFPAWGTQDTNTESETQTPKKFHEQWKNPT